MKEWARLSDCVGKTIAGVDDVDDENFVIAFSDQSWTTVSIERAKYPESWDRIVSEKTAPIDARFQLMRLGLMTEGEAEALRREEREKLDQKRLALELAELARLKAKFEGGG